MGHSIVTQLARQSLLLCLAIVWHHLLETVPVEVTSSWRTGTVQRSRISSAIFETKAHPVAVMSELLGKRTVSARLEVDKKLVIVLWGETRPVSSSNGCSQTHTILRSRLQICTTYTQ